MKIGELKSLGHNIADSLGCRVGLLVGYAETDVFAEASSSAAGYIVVDFLSGTTDSVEASPKLKRVIRQYREAPPVLCGKHNCNPNDLAVMTARYGVDKVYGPHFTVTVEASDGRRSTDRYLGVPGRRLQVRAGG